MSIDRLGGKKMSNENLRYVQMLKDIKEKREKDNMIIGEKMADIGKKIRFGDYSIGGYSIKNGRQRIKVVLPKVDLSELNDEYIIEKIKEEYREDGFKIEHFQKYILTPKDRTHIQYPIKLRFCFITDDISLRGDNYNFGLTGLLYVKCIKVYIDLVKDLDDCKEKSYVIFRSSDKVVEFEVPNKEIISEYIRLSSSNFCNVSICDTIKGAENLKWLEKEIIDIKDVDFDNFFINDIYKSIYYYILNEVFFSEIKQHLSKKLALFDGKVSADIQVIKEKTDINLRASSRVNRFDGEITLRDQNVCFITITLKIDGLNSKKVLEYYKLEREVEGEYSIKDVLSKYI